MTTFVDAHPVARTRHQCGVCRWWIEPEMTSRLRRHAGKGGCGDD